MARLPDSTLLSATPWPTSGHDSCITTFAAPPANDQKSSASAIRAGRPPRRGVVAMRIRVRSFVKRGSAPRRSR
ncbi:hypothetical protein [Prescottella equi]|uniref:hypothetical protein n=1 Tax=Rhodococcus hoagii TaxID=43767 RepID=UPI001F3291FB|nr:hypothetical protein [Prescottella equi]